MYKPPFTITSEIVDLVSKISVRLGKFEGLASPANSIELRKENRIKTIHSSLAIEQNSLRKH